MKNQREIKKKDPEFYRKLLALLIPMVVQNLMKCTGKCVRCVNGRYAGPEFTVRSFACYTDFFCPESLLCGDYDRNNGHGRLFPAESG